MSGFKDMFEWRTTRGEPVSAGGYVLTPESRALVVKTPYYGFVWNRPMAVEVEGPEGRRRILIPNVLLMAQVGLLGLTLSLGLASLWRGRRS